MATVPARMSLVTSLMAVFALAGCGGANEDDAVDPAADGEDTATSEEALTSYSYTCYGSGRQAGQHGTLRVSGTTATFKEVAASDPACAFGQAVSPPIPCAWTAVKASYDPTYKPRTVSRKNTDRFLDGRSTPDQHEDSATRELYIEKVLRTGGRELAGGGHGGNLIFSPTSTANAGFDGGNWKFFCRRK